MIGGDANGTVDLHEDAGHGDIALVVAMAHGASFEQKNGGGGFKYWYAEPLPDPAGWNTIQRAAIYYCLIKRLEITPLGNDAHSCAPNVGENCGQEDNQTR